MKKIFLLLPFLFLASCTSTNPSPIQCDLEDGLEGTIAFGLEQLVTCTGGTAPIRSSVNSWVDKAGVCGQTASVMKTASSVVTPTSICGVVVAAAAGELGTLVTPKFPTSWGTCTLSSGVSAVLSDAASLACNAVFPAAMSLKKKK